MLHYKIMIIDDDVTRKDSYKAVFNDQRFELLFVQSPEELNRISNETPVDAYIIDAILDLDPWNNILDAATLFDNQYLMPPCPTPVFLISRDWSEPNALKVLNLNLRHVPNIEILRYFAWQEFEEASQEGTTGTAKLVSLREKIHSDLAIWHEHSTLKKQPNETIRILLLSDVQYTDPHTSKAVYLDELSIGRALNKDELIPDLIAITGDIVFTGEPHEYEFAKEKIERLMSFMWTSDLDKWRDRLILVPGNHDVNFRMSACNKYNWSRSDQSWKLRDSIENENSSLYFSYQNYALEPFRQFAKDITGSRHWDTYLTKCRVDRRFETLGLRFYLLNTVEEVTVDRPKNYALSQKNLRAITLELTSKDEPKNFFSLALSHHGNILYDKPEDIINNWGAAGKAFFINQEIKLWLFGHQHRDSLPQPEVLTKDHMLYRIEAPTLKIDTPGTQRGFSVIELERQDNKVSGVRVHQYTVDLNGTITRSSSPTEWQY